MDIMAILSWILMILVASFDVIGLIEGVKSISVAIKAKKGQAWPILSFGFSVLVAVFLGNTKADIFGSKMNAILFAAVTIFSFIELLGYNVIVKWIFTVIDSKIDKIDPSFSSNYKTPETAEKIGNKDFDRIPRVTLTTGD